MHARSEQLQCNFYVQQYFPINYCEAKYIIRIFTEKRLIYYHILSVMEITEKVKGHIYIQGMELLSTNIDNHTYCNSWW